MPSVIIGITKTVVSMLHAALRHPMTDHDIYTIYIYNSPSTLQDGEGKERQESWGKENQD